MNATTRPRLIILGCCIAAALLATAGVTLVVKTRPRPVTVTPADEEAYDDTSALAASDVPADSAARRELVEAFGPLADAMHRLQAFWGNPDALARAEQALADVKQKHLVAAEEAKSLIADAEDALRLAHRADDEAREAYETLDHEAGLHKDPASRPSQFASDFTVSEQRAAMTGKGAAAHAKAFFDRYDELRGEHVR